MHEAYASLRSPVLPSETVPGVLQSRGTRHSSIVPKVMWSFLISHQACPESWIPRTCQKHCQRGVITKCVCLAERFPKFLRTRQATKECHRIVIPTTHSQQPIQSRAFRFILQHLLHGHVCRFFQHQIQLTDPHRTRNHPHSHSLFGCP